jgi:peptidoglycan/xylan/chitin deacetylase (PgdA/CDA1 family)
MDFLITNDVELHSIPKNTSDPSIADDILKTGLPRLLDLYAKYNVKSTFYFTGDFVEIKPEAVELVKEHGHEIGCHGYTHDINKAFDVLTLEEQVNHLFRAKKIIEAVSGPIRAFKAPALRINENTIKALEITGFSIDSSVASQRFDGPMSFGSKKKLNWLISPRLPYHPSSNSPFRKGNSPVLEIPVSAALFPYIGTLMRVHPPLFRILEKILLCESKLTSKPLVFIFHPNECLDYQENSSEKIIIERRSKSFIEYLFADKLRQNLKLKNLGMNAIRLHEESIKKGKESGFDYISISEYEKKFRKVHG